MENTHLTDSNMDVIEKGRLCPVRILWVLLSRVNQWIRQFSVWHAG
jgi:hypothetical protein